MPPKKLLPPKTRPICRACGVQHRAATIYELYKIIYSLISVSTSSGKHEEDEVVDVFVLV